MTAARDVAREIANELFRFESNRDKAYELIAAALSERERWAVEACCKAVCVYCAKGIPAQLSTHGVCFHYGADGLIVDACLAAVIRTAAARSEVR